MLDNKKLYTLLKEKGVKSIKQLSEVTRIPYTTLNYMLNGHDMYVSSLVELSRFLEVPVDYLINKSYGVVIYKEGETVQTDTTSIIEATALYMI